VVLKSSKNKKAAFDFINFCVSPENNQLFNERTGQIPSNSKSAASGYGKVYSYSEEELRKYGYVPDYEILSNQLSAINKRFEAEILPLL
jgi:putative spermidine/putrescine transport system substrate-binding protein